MLTEQGCKDRQTKLIGFLPEGTEGALIGAPHHIIYFTNLYLSPLTFSTVNTQAYLLVLRSQHTVLFIDNVAARVAKNVHVDEIVVVKWYDHIRTPERREEAILDEVAAYIKKNDIRQVAVESNWVPMRLSRLLPTDMLSPYEMVSSNIETMRRTKSPDELMLIRSCGSAARSAFERLRDQLRPGMTEQDVYLSILNTCHEVLGSTTQVYGDFVSGARTGEGGGPPSRRQIEAGDALLLDFSVVHRHYRCDLADTLVCAPAQTKVLEMREHCRAALQAAKTILCAGTPAKAVFFAAEQYLKANNLAQYHRSHMGHGIGLGHPESPYLVPKSQDTLQVGDVTTIEVGLYFPEQFGVRVEENFLVTGSGYEVLGSLLD